MVELRDKLGLLENEYKTMGDFKKRVLTVAIDQINKFTDIDVSYDQKKKERRELHILNFLLIKDSLIVSDRS
ncbi:RepB family plasmid replication initiator protein [Acinetobacter baumannii]|uniref:RepB family plasmid replication initiator protein n=1 Tax=Acinetobacter baumannii TaxID=470 RepID=UPI002949DF55|nr:RepB family plasmid replication initiator protein [Acinetobacter baumannii]MDV5263249.1 RepB family plasmid replication initiator protein [Acinetobacter baumannii]